MNMIFRMLKRESSTEELKIPIYLGEDVLLYLQGRKRVADLSSIATSQRNKFVCKDLR